MRKFLVSVAVVAVTANAALAGGMAEPIMESEPVVEQASSSNGGIIIPLLLILIIAVAMSSGGGSTPVPLPE